jgi:hypothetical protein
MDSTAIDLRIESSTGARNARFADILATAERSLEQRRQT